MARNIYGLDLGTYEIKIFDKKKVRIWREKNVIAMKDKKYIFSVGNEAGCSDCRTGQEKPGVPDREKHG